jgi:hypothetical protein
MFGASLAQEGFTRLQVSFICRPDSEHGAIASISAHVVEVLAAAALQPH